MRSRSCADWTEIASPLPSVPLAEFANNQAIKTIDENPELFVIDTPINIDKFEALLTIILISHL
jgi:hypothetical protein